MPKREITYHHNLYNMKKNKPAMDEKNAKFESDAYSYKVEKIYSDLYGGGHKLCSPPYKPL